MNLNSTFIFQTIVFLVLAWFTMKFVWPPLTKALDERAHKVAEGLAAADRAKLELNEAHKRVDAELSQSRSDNQTRLAEAEKQGAAVIAEARKTAEAEKKRILDEAEAEAAQEMQRARDTLRDQVAALAVKGAEQILKVEIDASKHAALLAELKAQL
ncbi:MAG TPA: F0F1 ATP synthase subunit B [Polyangiales bacterium]|nr:F0F1 ATP synthase subunit B [Polyangiales bacterium]